jgi:hypothetical protein
MEQEPGKYYTKLEVEIQNFISKYGVDELIKWLAEYSKTISQTDFNMFHRIQKFTCQVYDIPIADINGHNSTGMEMNDAKKTISYLTHRNTRLQNKHLAKLQNCTTRTINNHVKEVKFRVATPQAFKSFIVKYDLIIQKLEDHAT